MSHLDWIIMLGTLMTIVVYGVIKTRNINNMRSYLQGDKDLPWFTIGLSIMATQASAITFLSAPGQAFEEGMGFAQFYFGMPIAMVILCIFVLPIYYKLNVYTAYEYLENRFDLKTRTLTAILFLIQRGLAAGLTIFAPAIILTNILGWDLNYTILFIGILVVIYTVAGGTKAVSVTQKQQMIVILTGMVIAAVILVFKLPVGMDLTDSISLAGKLGKLEVVDLEFDLNNKYNLWSGLFGGVFLFMSYFGTDQSQVQRYLSGKSLTESRLGLLFNGLIKVPMQFLILFVGVLVFIFFQFFQAPIHFNQSNLDSLPQEASREMVTLENQYRENFREKKAIIEEYLTDGMDSEQQNEFLEQIRNRHAMELDMRGKAREIILKANPEAEVKDGDYVFITFITQHLPAGLVGLLLAVIFSAAMSSTASELNALSTTFIIDIYKRSLSTQKSDPHYLAMSKFVTIVWGFIAMGFAMAASLFDNLIEAVNIVGSLFYGTILGIFLVAFFFKKIKGNAVFFSALIAESIILGIFTADYYGHIQLAYLWLNLIGCALVIGFALLFSIGQKDTSSSTF